VRVHTIVHYQCPGYLPKSSAPPTNSLAVPYRLCIKIVALSLLSSSLAQDVLGSSTGLFLLIFFQTLRQLHDKSPATAVARHPTSGLLPLSVRTGNLAVRYRWPFTTHAKHIPAQHVQEFLRPSLSNVVLDVRATLAYPNLGWRQMSKPLAVPPFTHNPRSGLCNDEPRFHR
jgi:hypothetical protein